MLAGAVAVKLMKVNEIRDMSADEQTQKLKSLKEELFNLRFSSSPESVFEDERTAHTLKMFTIVIPSTPHFATSYAVK